jgi:hypothetical protein
MTGLPARQRPHDAADSNVVGEHVEVVIVSHSPERRLTDARLKIRVDNGDALTSSSHFEPHRPSRLPWRPSQNYPMATPSTLVEKIVGSV